MSKQLKILTDNANKVKKSTSWKMYLSVFSPMRKNMDQNNSEYGHILRSEVSCLTLTFFECTFRKWGYIFLNELNS